MIDPLTATLDCKIRDVFSTPKRMALMRALLREAVDVLHASMPREKLKGLDETSLMKYVLNCAKERTGVPSPMLEDCRAGRREQTEVDYINGYIVNLGKQHGADVLMNGSLAEWARQGKIIADDELTMFLRLDKSLFIRNHRGESQRF